MADLSLPSSSSSCARCSSSMSTSEHESIKIPSTSDKMTVDKKIHAMVYRTTTSLPDATIVFHATTNERSSSSAPNPVKS